MAGLSEVDARVLGQLLVMQSVIGTLPDPSVMPFVLQGLSDIPGIGAISFHPEADGAGSPPLRFALKTQTACYGELVLSIEDVQAFTPYIDHLRNFVFMLALILEGRQQQQAIRRHQQQLEQQVAERTARLASAEANFRLLATQAPYGICIINSDNSSIEYCNPTFTRMLGYTREDVPDLATWWQKAYPDAEYRQMIMASWQSVVVDPAAPGVVEREFTVCGRDGQRRDIRFLVVHLDDGRIAVTFDDVTERKRVIEELARHRDLLEQLVLERTHDLTEKNHVLETTLAQLRQLQNELIQSSKLSSLGEIVAGVAHELNTPIGNARMVATTLCNQSEVFALRLQDASGIRKSDFYTLLQQVGNGARLLEDNLTRAVQLIQSFKQVAVDRVSSQRRTFDLRAVTEEVIATLRPTLRKTPFVVNNDIEPGIRMDGYPGPYGQVIVNLIENAIVHGLCERTHGQIRLQGQMVGAVVHLVVSDDGAGIAPENLPRIFDPFFTTRLGQGGSGLGLNIVFNIVTGLLGGKVRVDSQLGQGTRFSLTLPLIAPQHDEHAAGKAA